MKNRAVAIVFWTVGGLAHAINVLIPAIAGWPVSRGAALAAALAAVGLSAGKAVEAWDE